MASLDWSRDTREFTSQIRETSGEFVGLSYPSQFAGLAVNPPTFALEFHLPYYAWGKMEPTQRDLESGRQVDGMPIRRSEVVIPLEIKGHTQSTPHAFVDDSLRDYIHEAQISVMITGIDDWFWTAYSFVDIYFKDGDNTESVEHYSRIDPLMPSRDPHSCGQ